MRSPRPMSIIIACPHCGTRYQVPPETLGDAGRKVACAQCGKSWLAEPGAPPPSSEDDRLFSEADEAALDASFAAEEAALRNVPASVRQLLPPGELPPPEVMRSIAQIKAALAARGEKPVPRREPPAPPVREQQVTGLLAARFHRVLRGAAVGLLCGTIGGALLFRTEIVRLAPQLAGLYAAIGLEVNALERDLSDVTAPSAGVRQARLGLAGSAMAPANAHTQAEGFR